MSTDASDIAVDKMSELISMVPESPTGYALLALLVPLVIRAGISLIEAKRLEIENGFWLIFGGACRRKVGGVKTFQPTIGSHSFSVSARC